MSCSVSAFEGSGSFGYLPHSWRKIAFAASSALAISPLASGQEDDVQEGPRPYTHQDQFIASKSADGDPVHCHNHGDRSNNPMIVFWGVLRKTYTVTPGYIILAAREMIATQESRQSWLYTVKAM